MRIDLAKVCRVLLVINLAFWLVVVFRFCQADFWGKDGYGVIRFFILAEPVLYLIALIGVVKKIKIIYLLSILLSFGNVILSVSDQMGLCDYVSLGLSGAGLVSLLSVFGVIF